MAITLKEFIAAEKLSYDSLQEIGEQSITHLLRRNAIIRKHNDAVNEENWEKWQECFAELREVTIDMAEDFEHIFVLYSQDNSRLLELLKGIPDEVIEAW